MPGAKYVTVKVVNAIGYVEVGRTFGLEWLKERTGLNSAQVQSAMNRLLLREPEGEGPIVAIQRGHLWRLDRRIGEAGPAAPAVKDDTLLLLEIVEKAGPHIIAKDETGALFLVKKIGAAS